MARHALRRVADLGPGLVLAPERYDPRRAARVAARRRLDDCVEVLTGNASAASLAAEAAVLVLDTTHAYEGFVVFRHGLSAPGALRGAKRRLLPGDVIVSRLRPYLRQVALVDRALFQLHPAGNAVVASTEFFVLRGRDGFPAAALVPLLLTEPIQSALAAGQEGGHHPRFPRELLCGLPVPEAVVREAAAFAGELTHFASEVQRALRGSRGLVERVASALGAAPGPVRPPRPPPGAGARRPPRG